MSNTVDRRIVEMQFDNKDFESNVQTSVKSLDKLKKSLDLEESAKGLSALEKAGHRFSLDGMVQAAEAVTSKFSIMGTIGDQVLRRIGDAAFNALNKMKGFVDSLTIQPISTGLQEYETQINAIQTILSNTRDKMTKQGLSDAERLEIVNDRLDQLNHYADKTIYNFTEMTRNIGTFTAAGVELDVAVQSIQGIANLAAVSGSTSEQASRAMYQLSQAISTGTVRLLDWNSVVNAGMGGEVFQQALIRTATAMGKTVDVTVTETNAAGKKVTKTVKRTVKELIETEGSFRESLSKGWLTSDILTATLEQFSWDFEQIAKEMGYDAAHMEEGVLAAMEMKRESCLLRDTLPKKQSKSFSLRGMPLMLQQRLKPLHSSSIRLRKQHSPDGLRPGNISLVTLKKLRRCLPASATSSEKLSMILHRQETRSCRNGMMQADATCCGIKMKPKDRLAHSGILLTESRISLMLFEKNFKRSFPRQQAKPF